MRPGARVAAAIDILDQIAEGDLPTEQALTRWARGSRFAGSKDRAAIRDYVFDVARQYRLATHYGQGETGRALMIGLLHIQSIPHDDLFNGDGHAPAPLTDAERSFPDAPTDEGTLWNLPDWLLPAFRDSLGDKAADAAQTLQHRAPVTLRVNTARTSVPKMIEELSLGGIVVTENAIAPTALSVLEGARKIRNTPAYQDGLIELQDASSQAVVTDLPKGGRVLDFCAGGGGKALALAPAHQVYAHDIDPARMRDLPARAARAQADIDQLATADLAQYAPFDVVLCDAPCSGSGAWRRAPEGKWKLTPDRLAEMHALQAEVLENAAPLVAPDGRLIYATCSVLESENEARIADFIEKNPDWQCLEQRRIDLCSEGDGFFFAHLRRK